MSNYLGVAVVTATLQRLLQESLQDVVPGMTVRLGPPRAAVAGEGAEASLLLLQTVANRSLRNDDLPTRQSNGDLVLRPTIALELHYLITFFGEQNLAAERMFGRVATAFQASPMLGYEQFAATVAPGGSFHYLSSFTPPQDAEPVRLTCSFPSIEELSKIWSMFPQVPHRLSLLYIVGPVLLEAELPLVPRGIVTESPFATAAEQRRDRAAQAARAKEAGPLTKPQYPLQISSKRDV